MLSNIKCYENGTRTSDQPRLFALEVWRAQQDRCPLARPLPMFLPKTIYSLETIGAFFSSIQAQSQQSKKKQHCSTYGSVLGWIDGCFWLFSQDGQWTVPMSFCPLCEPELPASLASVLDIPAS